MSKNDTKKTLEMTPETEALVEDIAQKVHAAWVDLRKKDGWTYGPKRNDDTKQTPCLVPYEQLPEEEKQYDRNTAVCAIRALIENGYELIPPKK